MKFYLFWLTVIFLGFTAAVQAAPHVALMNFSTDDNSYRSAQSAADFTSLLQIQLADAPEVEWVERAQLELAKKELGLSEMDLISAAMPMRWGKWAKADWMIKGQFSLDDKNQRTLFVEITDLQHADVLASRTITFTDPATSQFQIVTNQVEIANGAVRELLSEARVRQQQAAGKVLVAPLFLAEVTGRGSGFGFSSGNGALEQNFNEALEQAAATNSRVQLIRFPKAYRSTDESEMVLDGLVEANRNAWQQAADLFVWGTCEVKRKTTPGKPPEAKLEIAMHLWDGASPPAVIKEEMPCSFNGGVQPNEAAAALDKLVSQVMAHAHKITTPTDTTAFRKGIAQSLVETYDQMTLSFHRREELGLNEPEKFLQAVHMLETACFFDPDNAEARVLYITCRWGWWMDFNFKVKNEFWSKWRRSQAWGNYANRFGLTPVTEELPFPYQQEGGIPAMYVQSLEDVSEMFPQWHSAEEMALEDKWQKQGVDTWLMEAERHGFPKEMPHDLAMKWKTEVQIEHWKRLNKAANFMSDALKIEGKMPPSILSTVFHEILNANQPAPERLALLEKIWPKCVESAEKYGKQWVIGAGQLADDQEQLLVDLCAQAGQPEKGSQLLAMLSQKPNQSSPTNQSGGTHPSPIQAMTQSASQMVSTPAWARDIQTFYSMFRLFPPNALPLEVKPTMQEIQFPKQFEVQKIDRLGFLDDQLLILAMDERSAPSSDNNPDISAELLDKHNRLWVLKPSEETPTLYEPEKFPQSVTTFLVKDDQLWVAGKTTGYLDLQTHEFRKFGLTDGFNLQQSDALGIAGGSIFAAGNNFKVARYDEAPGRWSDLPLPPARLSSGTGSPFLLVGNQQSLGYVAGSVLIRDCIQNTWTNLAELNSVQQIMADDSGFWFGGWDGLHFYDPARQALKHWTTPAVINGLFISMMGSSFTGNSEMPAGNLARMGEQIQGMMRKLQADRAKNHATNRERHALPDPLHLDWRVPGEVTALANEGDFLWLGVGNHLLLLHKPSHSMVASCAMPVRDTISSLAVSKNSVWIGTAYGDHKLLQIPKEAFTSIPQSRWVSLAISPGERARLVGGMSVRDQAMYAFYAGDDARVAALLGGLDPAKAGLEEMFILAFSYDASGLDRPELARTWFENIISRYPDSPWSKTAQTVLAENEQNHKTKVQQEQLLAKYDRNKNGRIDPDEKRAMESDPDYQREKKVQDSDQLKLQVKAIMQKFDRNGDGKLDAEELESLKSQVSIYLQAPPQMLAGRKILVAPLLNKNFPSVPAMLKKYDVNHDGCLEAAELNVLAQDMQPER